MLLNGVSIARQRVTVTCCRPSLWLKSLTPSWMLDDVLSFSSSILALLGEEGRRQFLEIVGKHLDRYGAAIQHRQAWASLLLQV
ncbi:MAG: hypothetical protein HY667_06855 [Chloroflexi bacterium]|nr:hypothetical protein [Chloroflexota bacterium]